MSSYFPVMLGASWLAAFLFWRRQQARFAELEKAYVKVQLEESRMFEFLREIGAAFSEDVRSEDLHRIIVEAAIRILGAHGGGLYVSNRQSAALVPSYISKNCPPLVEVPPHVLSQSESTPVALQGYLKRHPVNPGEGIIGEAWKLQEAVLLSGDDPRLAACKDTKYHTETAMVVPLAYSGQRLGVLAIANGAMSRDFNDSDFTLYKAIAEQSAFALYSANIYSEAAEKRRLDQDLLVAQDIQRILLPSSAPDVSGFEICGLNIPALRVSGDYYDYIHVDGERTGVVIADVSGKGVPAALIMAMCRSVLRNSASGSISAAEVLRKVNRQLYPDIKEDMFISMAYLILSECSNKVMLCRAGHDAPLHYSAKEQTVSKINPPGMAVGIDSGDVFDRITGDFSVSLEPNDCLVLYTDGVTEALDSKGYEFGMKNMIQSIQASASGGAPAIVARLTDDLRAFVGAYPQNDDITLIVIRKT